MTKYCLVLVIRIDLIRLRPQCSIKFNKNKVQNKTPFNKGFKKSKCVTLDAEAMAARSSGPKVDLFLLPSILGIWSKMCKVQIHHTKDKSKPGLVAKERLITKSNLEVHL